MTNRIKGQRQRAAVAIGAQTHIGAKHKTVGGDFIQNSNQMSPDFYEKLLIADGFGPAGHARFRIGKEEVDVRGEI